MTLTIDGSSVIETGAGAVHVVRAGHVMELPGTGRSSRPTPPTRLPPDPTLSTTYWDAQVDDERRRRGQELVAAHEATADLAERRSLEERFDRLRRWFDLDADHTELDRLAEMDLDWVRSMFESGGAVDWPETMREVDLPVLLALGEYDFVAPPTWTLHWFRRSGHTPYLEEADEFVRVTERWLASGNW